MSRFRGRIDLFQQRSNLFVRYVEVFWFSATLSLGVLELAS